MNDNFLLTVVCMTYNHEKYIRRALDGFVNQQTKYKYRVIVHDDASTDNTADIILEYANKYPDIIIPILEEENQYQKKVSVFKTVLEKHLDTKYYATCEGDDYWCDINKVQIQVDYLESNQDCVACVHNTELINEVGDSLHRFINDKFEDYDLTTDEIIKAGGGGRYQTSSIMMRTEARLNKPDAFSMPHVGDYPLGIYLSTCGRIHYFGRVMSCYRVNASGSWSSRFKKNKRLRNNYYNDAINALKEMNVATDYRYKDSFSYAIMDYRFAKASKPLKLLYAMINTQFRHIFKTHYEIYKRKRI